MKQQHLIEKRLGFIADCVADIRKLGDVANLRADRVQQRFLEHTLQLAVQAMLDTAFAIASEQSLGEPGSNRQVFEGLVQAGWIPEDVAATCRRMVAFRNIVVHRYLEVDLAILQAIVERHLDDLLAFVRAVRDRLQAGDGA